MNVGVHILTVVGVPGDNIAFFCSDLRISCIECPVIGEWNTTGEQ